MAVPFYMDINFWIMASMGMGALLIVLFIFLILIVKWTHAIQELKAKLKGVPISLIFFDNHTLDWITDKNSAGMIENKDYGSFLINKDGSYVDKKTRNIVQIFDGGLATSASVKVFKLAADLQHAIKDEKKMVKIREALINGEIQDEHSLTGLKENINFSHLKSLLNSLVPHNLNSLIEMKVAQRMSGLGKIPWMTIVVSCVAFIGATTICIILLKMYG